jgi:hypothetical protein
MIVRTYQSGSGHSRYWPLIYAFKGLVSRYYPHSSSYASVGQSFVIDAFETKAKLNNNLLLTKMRNFFCLYTFFFIR